MATFKAIIFKGDIHIKQDNTTNIKIRITHNGKSEYIATDLYVHAKKFAKGFASGGEAATFLNSRIRDEIEKYTQRYWKLGSLPERLTVKELKERIMVDHFKDEIDFLKFADDYSAELISKGREGTARSFRGAIAQLKKFREKLNFNEITLQFLNDYISFLKKKGVKNGVDNYIRALRRIFREGQNKYNDEDRDLIRIPHYPFKKLKYDKPVFKTKENVLTVEEIQKIINYKPTRGRQQMAKDMFLLMFYLIGINAIDLFNLGRPDKKGRINYVRAKTGKDYSIKLEPEALEIIERYKGTDLLVNMSCRYKNHLDMIKYINLELKDMGNSIQKKLRENDEDASFPTEITTNWARHSWATIARNECRINKDDVALCLGHDDMDNKVTDIYINYDYSIVDNSNRKVLDQLLEKKAMPNKLKNKPASSRSGKSPSPKKLSGYSEA